MNIGCSLDRSFLLCLVDVVMWSVKSYYRVISCKTPNPSYSTHDHIMEELLLIRRTIEQENERCWDSSKTIMYQDRLEEVFNNNMNHEE